MLTVSSYGDDRPNFIFIFTDDQQADSIGALGNSKIKTPNLDRLVKEGFSFRNNYCGGSFSGAVCIASRTMLMTGHHWYQVRDKNDWNGFETLPEILRKNGYKTHIVGKWHNGKKSLLRSFDQGSSVFLGGMTDHLTVPLNDIQGSKIVNERTEEGFSSTMFADAAIDFIKEKQDKPFFLYVALTAPHDTRNPPVRYREMYYDKVLSVPENFMDVHPFNNGLMGPKFRDENLAPWPRPREMIRDQMAEYYGLITHMDEQIGRFLDVYRSSGNTENTYIIFTSDHGLSLGQHGLMGKQSLYEHSMKSPLIVNGPKVRAGRSSNALVYIHDLFPSLLHLAGIEHDSPKKVFDISEIWEGQKRFVRDSLFLGFDRRIRSVRDNRWKLLVYPEINHQQLFDLNNDPLEMENLAEVSENKEVISRLTEIMKDWQKVLGDGQALYSDNPLPKEYDWKSFKQRRDRWQPDWIYDKYFRD